eukprot:3459090-Amphidinium_carterae.1
MAVNLSKNLPFVPAACQLRLNWAGPRLQSEPAPPVNSNFTPLEWQHLCQPQGQGAIIQQPLCVSSCSRFLIALCCAFYLLCKLCCKAHCGPERTYDYVDPGDAMQVLERHMLQHALVAWIGIPAFVMIEELIPMIQ